MSGARAEPFRGRSLRSHDAAGARVSENAYAASSCLPSHGHERAFLCLTLAGGYVERHGARSVDYGPGALAFHPAGGEHAVSIGAMEARCLNVEVRTDWLERIAESGGGRPDFVRAIGGPPAWLAERLLEETRTWSSPSQLCVESLVFEILAVLFRSRTVASDRLPPAWLGEVEEILRHEFTSTLTVAELANRVGVHPVHLSRTWRRFRRSPVGEAVRRLRIDEARARLASGTDALVDLAVDLGFADQAHFTRAFRRITGTTPATYRRQAASGRGGRSKAVNPRPRHIQTLDGT
jgi:AraC family transcriptional regulator